MLPGGVDKLGYRVAKGIHEDNQLRRVVYGFIRVVSPFEDGVHFSTMFPSM